MSGYEAVDVFTEKHRRRYDQSLAAFVAKKINILELHKQPGHRFFVVRRDEEDIVAMAIAREVDDGIHLDTLIVTDEQHRLNAYIEVCEALFAMGYFRFTRKPDSDADYELLTGDVLGFETIGQAPDWTVELRVKT